METFKTAAFGEKEIAHTLLAGEKYLTGIYNTALSESATPEVRRTLQSLLDDTHGGQQKLFEEVNSRGWYPLTKAEDKKIADTKQKFGAAVTQ